VLVGDHWDVCVHNLETQDVIRAPPNSSKKGPPETL
jgi:hypothetical protein